MGKRCEKVSFRVERMKSHGMLAFSLVSYVLTRFEIFPFWDSVQKAVG